jgi:hypothetical protein
MNAAKTLAVCFLLLGCGTPKPSPPAVCDASTCAGCCAGTQCVTQVGDAQCGQRGQLCQNCGTQACQNGTCQAKEVMCPASQTNCSGQCFDLKTNGQHCGSCATVCSNKETCTNGVCECKAGMSHCGDVTCIDVLSNNDHCGACNNACPSNRTCKQGVCSCPGTGTLCSNQCVETSTSTRHCGACGTICKVNEVCSAGMCECSGNFKTCDAKCINSLTDNNNCGTCGTQCPGGQTCTAGTCQGCILPAIMCNGACATLATDALNCGMCGKQCAATQICSNGICKCAAGQSQCGNACINTSNDILNCGGCGVTCPIAGSTCQSSTCVPPCPSGTLRCGGLCVNTANDVINCGACNVACNNGTCTAGGCQSCNSATTDCDGDGWKVSEGDCCDDPTCASDPKQINPGAVEFLGNSIDENCNGLLGMADTLDTSSCDSALTSNSAIGNDAAKAVGLCRFTTSMPATPQQRTWGVISAQWLRADGSALGALDAHSIRSGFGTSMPAQEGSKLLVISSGIAADATQTLPGPNGGPMNTQSNDHIDLATNISTCTLSTCIKDWFSTPNPPLKAANALPTAPMCGMPSSDNLAEDSVMLRLVIRAPTNARSFTFRARFLSVEYPEFVCSEFNDQFVALVDTPSGSPRPLPNPVDKNLMTYEKNGSKWPIGINVAGGTDLFSVCDTQATNPTCWEMPVSTLSCMSGSSQLAGTGFEAPNVGDCTEGGATAWLTTTGSVIPGQLVELRLAIWDVGDTQLDSTALIDQFTWSSQPLKPGTD